MIAQGAKVLPGIIGATAATLFWGLSFWQIVRLNRGNKVIECGVFAIIVLLAMAFLSRVIELPDWALVALIALLLFLCVATLFFFAKECYRSLQHRKPR
jgi:membrane protein YdbS with pleckstrin-like domain